MGLDIWLKIQVDTGGAESYTCELYSAGITHNVNSMWREAGVYDVLYNGEGKTAGEAIEILERGLEDMKSDPAKYKAMNPSNGSGDYDGAVDWLDKFLRACKQHPKSRIKIWS